MQFVKMQGCANDFIVTDDFGKIKIQELIAMAPSLCDRRRGIGADGIICVLPSKTADFGMRIINADGSEAEMCGNGIRCMAVYCQRKGLSAKTALAIETNAGIIQTEFKNDQVRVNMRPPILAGSKIPVARSDDKPFIMEPTFSIIAVSMGNPHAVIFTDKLTDELVLTYGAKIEQHPFFPKKTNVEFVKIRSKTEIDMRVFERGCGETMACGTGACASVVAGILTEKLGPAVTVHLSGGDLLIEWDGNPANPVFMTGPALWVFEGSVGI